jgi:hypothetical protein
LPLTQTAGKQGKYQNLIVLIRHILSDKPCSIWNRISNNNVKMFEIYFVVDQGIDFINKIIKE